MGKPCRPTCPFFRCGNKALIYKGTRPVRLGRFERDRRSMKPSTPVGSFAEPPLVLCSLDNEPCQGPKCKYAFCEKRALLPDGSCGLEERLAPKPTVSIEEEAAKMERAFQQIRGRLKRRGLLEEL